MEKYSGIKFCIRHEADDFTVDDRLARLNEWANLLGELGLAPVHPGGAYGNQSYRMADNSFVISRTGMVPSRKLDPEDYCLVDFDSSSETFVVKGKHQPSSESFLHLFIYRQFPQVNAIMHGHSALLNRYAADLKLPVTPDEFPYGTRDLAQSAIDLLVHYPLFILLKNHGFVAVGETIMETGSTVLRYYSQLIELLIKKSG